MNTKPIPHGTISGRKHYKCTCEPCVEAGRAYARRVHRQRGYGTWRPFVDAEPVREHVLTLVDAGVSLKRISELAGITHSIVARLVYEIGGKPRTARLRPETAAKLLAVPLHPSDRHRVDATGTRRRMRSLAAIGWPSSHIGPEIGVHPRHANELLRCAFVQQRTADAVITAYLRLSEQDPVDHGVDPAVVLRTRRQAAERGWPGPDAWTDDDLDAPEPTAEELALDAIEQALAGKPTLLTKTQQLHVTQVLTERGKSEKHIAAITGRSDRTIGRWRRANGWRAAA